MVNPSSFFAYAGDTQSLSRLHVPPLETILTIQTRFPLNFQLNPLPKTFHEITA